MFRRIDDDASRGAGTFEFEGRQIPFRDGDTIAAALLAAGVAHLRTHAVTHAPRAPHCMMGICFECLAEVDGVQNQQTCLLPAAENMRVTRQHGVKVLR